MCGGGEGKGNIIIKIMKIADFHFDIREPKFMVGFHRHNVKLHRFTFQLIVAHS